MKDKIFEIENYGSLNRAVEELCAYLLASAVSPERVFDSKLVAYELLANVLKHTESSATFSGWIEDGFVRLKIVSRHAFCPAEREDAANTFTSNQGCSASNNINLCPTIPVAPMTPTLNFFIFYIS